MKKLITVILVLSLLFTLCACGAPEEDPNAGIYQGVSATVMGLTMPMADIYEGETWLELESGGKGTMMLDGDSFAVKWTAEGEVITLTASGQDSTGTLKNGEIAVDLMNMGCIMTFRREDAQTQEGGSANTATYADAGYWELVRMDSEDPAACASEEDLAQLKDLGIVMYLELLEDGTGVFVIDDPMEITWQDGTVTAEGLSISYTLEGENLVMPMMDTVFVFRRAEKPAQAE